MQVAYFVHMSTDIQEIYVLGSLNKMLPAYPHDAQQLLLYSFKLKYIPVAY